MKTKRLLTISLLLCLVLSLALLAGCGCDHTNVAYQFDEYTHKLVCLDCDKVVELAQDHQWEGTYCSVCKMGEEYTQGLEYELSSNEAYYSVVGRGTFEGQILNISPLYYGKPVQRIASSAFVQNFVITEATIPNTIDYIGEMAIDNCINLTKVTFAEGSQLSTIGRLAFAYNPNLTEITIPASVTDVKEAAFYSCQALTIYCEGTKSQGNPWHTQWNMDNRPVVWDCANNDKASDGNVYVIVDGVRYAISSGKAVVAVQTQGIMSAHIPAKISYKGSKYDVTAIAPNAFQEAVQGDAWHLQQITFDDNSVIAKVGDNAFENCIELKQINLPNTVTSIGKCAFRHCWELQSFTIPPQVTELQSDVFASCYELTEITIPGTVTKIEPYAFFSCMSLKKINFVVTKGWVASGENPNTLQLEKITLMQSDVSNPETIAEWLLDGYKYLGYTLQLSN